MLEDYKESTYMDSIYRQPPEDKAPSSPKSEQEQDKPGASLLKPQKKNRKKLLPWISLFIVCCVALTGGLLWKHHKDHNKPLAKAPTSTATPLNNNASPTLEAQPFLSLYPQAPTVKAGKTTVALTSTGGLTSSQGEKFSLQGIKFQQASGPCTVNQATDFCLAGRALNQGTTYAVYYLKDAAHSRLFSNPNDFQQVTLAGAPAAATLEVNSGTQGPLPVVVAVTPSSAGWMIIATPSSPQKLHDIAGAIKLS